MGWTDGGSCLLATINGGTGAERETQQSEIIKAGDGFWNVGQKKTLAEICDITNDTGLTSEDNMDLRVNVVVCSWS